MQKLLLYTITLGLLCIGRGASAQTSIGIGTTTPDNHAVLDITSKTQGVLLPTLTAAQRNALGNILGPSEMGMIIIDANSGKQRTWTGNSWQMVAATGPLTAKAPLAVATNNLRINPGTAAGDLITWNGTNWVNMQPAVQHFNLSSDNHQPYLVNNYVIAEFGIFPSRNDASEPYLGEIYMMGCNFAPQGFAFCDGSLLSINQNSALFALLGTFYGGNGTSNFALPDLRGRIPVCMGTGTGLSTYAIGQAGGTETKTFSH